jgi:alginate O-acetyltransferase complex protein AlgI
MLFNSFEFLVFALIVIPIYFFLKHQYRWLWLLVSSCVFYMYFIPAFILVLFAVIIIDYIAAQKIFNAKQEHKKMWFF